MALFNLEHFENFGFRLSFSASFFFVTTTIFFQFLMVIFVISCGAGQGPGVTDGFESGREPGEDLIILLLPEFAHWRSNIYLLKRVIILNNKIVQE